MSENNKGQKKVKGPGFFSRFGKKKKAQDIEPEVQALEIDQPEQIDTDPLEEHKVKEPVTNKDEQAPKKKFFSRLRNGLSKTRDSLKGKMGSVLTVGRKIDEDLYEELEELLITSDLGVQTSMELIEKVRKTVDRKNLKDGSELKKELKKVLLETFQKQTQKSFDLDHRPLIALIVGVNGVGKTTTIGKLATHWKNQGKKVMVCAADTFRAAAVEQLQVWAGRAGVEIVLKEDSKDPASVVYDALQRAKNETFDMLLIDTAGRLHNNPNLMKELEKMHRIIGREFSGAPHHVFLILDAITGQNGLQQAKQFVQKVSVSDLIITKLDGTAKGGVAFAISNELNLPIRFVGVGEAQEDLLVFDPDSFVDSLFEEKEMIQSTKGQMG